MSSNAPKWGPSEEGGHVSSSSVRPDHGGEEEPVAYPGVNYVPALNNRTFPPSRSVYRMTLPSLTLSNSRSPHASQPVAGAEVRAELRDSKEVRGSKSVESNRDYKFDSRDMHYQSGKVEKEGRVEDGKEVKYDRDGNDSKNEVKVEKDVSAGAVAGVYPSLKDPHNAKRHPDIVGGGGISGTWSNSPSRAKYEASKEISIGNMNLVKERVEGNEAVGENIVDSKADDKYKDRKRKEGNHHDWSESDKDRSDSRSKLQPGSSSNNNFKEGKREERDSDRLEKEKKDNIKEKERLEKVIEKEKDNVDKEGKNGVEKDGQLNDKDVADKPSVKENISVEFKKPSDSWRNMEREAKERRKEREGDVEGERPEKRRCVEKESDEGVADVGEGTDKERDVFSYGVRLKKRMLRARGSPQAGNRDARVRSRGQDAEGSQGKPEVSTFYKVGECLQELTKLWTEHKSSQADNDIDNLYNGPTLEIRIPAEHVTATNRQVRVGQLWGTDIYTDDSDLVAVLMHTGYCRPTASPPPAAIQELCATIRVLPPQESYVSTLRNNVRSRAWGAAIGCSYRVERCCIMKKEGGSIDLEPCLTHTSTIEPTLAPVAVERTMTTRAAASNALRQQRFVREVTIQYNLCNEPWIKYSISIVADKGLKKPLYTSARLKKGEVLYLETHSCRYELCFASEKIVKNSSGSQLHEPETGNSQNHVSSVDGDRNMADGDNMVVDMFRWSKCKKPLPQKVMRSIGIPLPLDHVEVLEENVDWEDVQWSQTGVWIAGKEYQLARAHFLSPK